MQFCKPEAVSDNKTTISANMRYLSLNGFAVSVRSEAFRGNQDSVGTRGLYRHNTTCLLVLARDETTVEDR